jgi:hypothetical protein
MTPVIADAGVPMLVIELPLMALALLPVVLIEVVVVRRSVALPFRSALLDLGMANVASTLVGVPLAWAAMFVLEIATMLPTGGAPPPSADSPIATLASVALQAAWLPPYEAYLYWMIPVAATILLIPCFLVSVPIERWVLIRRWPTVERPVVRSAVLWANVWSYALLLVAGSIWTLVSIK